MFIENNSAPRARCVPTRRYGRLISFESGAANERFDLPVGDGLWLRGKTLYVVQNRLNVIARIQLDKRATRGTVVSRTTDPVGLAAYTLAVSLVKTPAPCQPVFVAGPDEVEVELVEHLPLVPGRRGAFAGAQLHPRDGRPVPDPESLRCRCTAVNLNLRGIEDAAEGVLHIRLVIDKK